MTGPRTLSVRYFIKSSLCLHVKQAEGLTPDCGADIHQIQTCQSVLVCLVN